MGAEGPHSGWENCMRPGTCDGPSWPGPTRVQWLTPTHPQERAATPRPPACASHCSSWDRVSSKPRRAGSSKEGPREARFSHLQGHPWGHGIPLGPSRLCHPEMTRGDMDRVNNLRRWGSQTGVTGRGQPQKWSEVAGLMLLRVAEARGTLITPHFMSRKRKNTNLL